MPRPLLALTPTLLLAFGAVPAAAHGSPGGAASAYEARLTRLSPPSTALAARAYDGAARLWLRVEPGHVVIVRGAYGEPMLRLSSGGVEANRRSLTAVADRILRAAGTNAVDPGLAPAWTRLTTARSYAWHDHRLGQRTAPGGGVRRQVGAFAIPLDVDGRSTRLTGIVVYVPPPTLPPWLALLAAPLAAAAALCLRAAPRARERGARILAAIAIGGALAALGGASLAGPRSSSGAAVEVAALAAAGAAMACLLWLAPRVGGLVAALGAGILALTVAAGQVVVLTRGVVLSALPDALARGAVVCAIGCGLAAAIVAVREVASAAQARAAP